MTTFLFLLLVFLFLLSLYLFQRWRDMSILKRNGIPGPPPNLITGNLFSHSRTPNVLKYNELFAKFGQIVGYYIGRKPNILINDIELIRRIQIKDFSNFSDRQTLGIKYGLHPNPEYHTHLITAQGSQWKELRTLLNPTFSAAKLKAMTPIMTNSIDILMGKIEKRASKGEEFDLYQDFQLLTTDVIAKCALGIDTDVQNNPDDEFFRAAKRLFDTQPSRFRLMFTCFPELDHVLYPLRRGLQIIEEWRDKSIQQTIARLIHAAIKLRSLGGSTSSSKNKKTDLLQLMLDAKMSKEEIANTSADALTINDEASEDEDEPKKNGSGNQQNKQQKSLSTGIVVATAIVFYEAGYETTSTTLGFIAHVLVNNPEIQERVREEVMELYRTENGVFDYNTVNKLSYMSQVINETMRFYPPVTTFVTRTTKEDYHYKDIIIPANSTVRIPINQIHHREDLWPEHNKFDPERFSPERKSTIDPVVFQPFGTGPRNCIGMRFALLEIKLTLARILYKFRLIPGPSTEKDLIVEYKPITQTPKNGVWVKAVPV